VFAAGSLARQGLADRYRSDATSELAAQPARALADANRSLRLNGQSVPSLYLKAAALARFGDAVGSRAALRTALRLEPHAFVTWALLGDLAVREHNLRDARVFYRHAHSLNPRDPGLAALAKDPVRPRR
jgi:cytochrome c-type biogenesis protein CcmH/NrfG